MTRKTLALIVILCEMAGNRADRLLRCNAHVDTTAANSKGNGHYHMHARCSAQKWPLPTRLPAAKSDAPYQYSPGLAAALGAPIVNLTVNIGFIATLLARNIFHIKQSC
jgi:hypothetical protein